MFPNVTRKNIRTPAYWEANAPWHHLWLNHNDYHKPVKEALARFVRPGWRVLDVGGGSGLLSLFLRARGCRAVLLEPDRAMLAIFELSCLHQDIRGIAVERKTWEEMPLEAISGYDLVLACNSLHVTMAGFRRSLAKAFEAGPAHVLVAAEPPHARDLYFGDVPGYAPVFTDRSRRPSSLVYHTLDEAFAHASFRVGRALEHDERTRLASALCLSEGRYRLAGRADLHLLWWTRRDGPENRKEATS